MTTSIGPIASIRRRGSLRRRLPLTVSLVLIATVTALGWVAYREVQAAVLQAVTERVRGTTRQLATLLAQSTVQRMEEARRLAARPVFRAALDVADQASVRDAQLQLDALLKTSPQLLSVELWRTPTGRLAEARATATPGGPVLPVDLAPEPPRQAGVMPLRLAGDILYTELAVSVPRAAPDSSAKSPSPGPEGFLVFRRSAAMPNAAAAMAALLGGGVSLRFGSRSAGVWTDLSKRVPAPPTQPANSRDLVAYDAADGQTWLGSEATVAGAPWSVWVEVPRSAALAPVRAFWQRVARVGGVIVALGTLLAWIISRRITEPLHALTGAAEAFAAGELSKRVRANRRDEVGRLGDAFNTMADRVQEGYERLDAGILERTRELEHTVAALQEAQEQLVRRERLAILGQLAGGVGHELRNPLGVMTNAVYYLGMVQTDASPEVHEYHGILRAQIALAEKIVGDLLDFSRIRPPRREHTAPADLVDAQLARLTIPSEVTVTSGVGPDLPPVDVDPVQVGQILLNLMLNAVQAVESPGGTVTVSATANARHIAIHVDDTGPGVPADLHAKIFEPLFTTKARGIGLGLAVSRSLAEANGGELTLSPVERGARFTLTLPVAAGRESGA